MKIRTGQSILILFLSLLLLVSCTKMTQAPEKEIDTEQTALNVKNGVAENTEIREEPEVEEEEEFIPEESSKFQNFLGMTMKNLKELKWKMIQMC